MLTDRSTFDPELTSKHRENSEVSIGVVPLNFVAVAVINWPGATAGLKKVVSKPTIRAPVLGSVRSATSPLLVVLSLVVYEPRKILPSPLPPGESHAGFEKNSILYFEARLLLSVPLILVPHDVVSAKVKIGKFC